MRPLLGVLLGILALLAGALPLHAREQQADRIVVIGDLHGDYAAYREIVAAAGLSNREGRWTGGKATLIQMGDIADRGPDSLRIIRDLRELARRAERAGGRVIVLVGNHEAMNIIGDLRYVDPGEYAAFADRRSPQLREQVYAANRAAIETFYAAADPPLDAAQARETWLAEYPLGKIEHRLAWSPAGEIGAWVAQLPATVLLDGTLFVHGGLSSEFARYPAEELNRMVSAAITQANAATSPLLEDPLGPLWYRGNIFREEGEAAELGITTGGDAALQLGPCEAPCALPGGDGAPAALTTENLCPPSEGEPAPDAARCPTPRLSIENELTRVLAAYGARRMIVGHTPSLDGIATRAGGRLILVDTGISAYYGGPRSYLELRGDRAVAWHKRQGGAWESSAVSLPGEESTP